MKIPKNLPSLPHPTNRPLTGTVPGSRQPLNGRVRQAAPLLMLCLLALLAPLNASAATLVPTAIPTSTWNPGGSPYILSANAAVTSGSTLTIHPGSEVILGPGVTLNVNGENARIRALGTGNEPIVFRATSPGATWTTIWVPDYGASANSVFRWCVFSNASTGLWLGTANDETETQEVSNCTFADCGIGLQGTCTGQDVQALPSPALNPLIQNCRFIDCVANGIRFTIDRSGDAFPYDRRGRANPIIRCNTFQDIEHTAIQFNVGTGASCQPQVVNNTFQNVEVGVLTRAPYDTIVKNNIFSSCGWGVWRVTSDSLNLRVNHNDFHDNGTNFFNYPSAYGSIVWNNANGHPADVSLNIFEDPLFAPGEALLLSPNSPAIDAGDPATTYEDACFPPSQGTSISDMGAYGGPGACNWGILCHPPTLEITPPRSACVGMEASFCVRASGTGPFAYQWRFHGMDPNGQPVEIEGATGQCLTLTGVEAGDAGYYSVVVSGACGAAASIPVPLNVLPVCMSLNLYPGLSITGQVGHTYCVQFTSELSASPAWTTLTNITLTTPEFFYLDPQPARTCGDAQAALPLRFYRVVEGPCP